MFGHRKLKTRHPVRSALSKQLIAKPVLQWVTMWESLVPNAFLLFSFLPPPLFFLPPWKGGRRFFERARRFGTGSLVGDQRHCFAYSLNLMLRSLSLFLFLLAAEGVRENASCVLSSPQSGQGGPLSFGTRSLAAEEVAAVRVPGLASFQLVDHVEQNFKEGCGFLALALGERYPRSSVAGGKGVTIGAKANWGSFRGPHL